MTTTSFFLYIFLGIVACFSYFHLSNLALDFFSRKNSNNFSQKSVLVFGSEGKGIRELVKIILILAKNMNQK